ncbi:MAG TPA: DUF4198 domain-containing protein [Pelagibacterium sp.]|nr:nickel transporter [Pelagibacterium sp.]HCO55089.1 DUF4198 domain-containing protein [Pelagibacterium sp.]|tara:strand:+ start:2459 stop:3274 length:816 start_codon:yes stop_codon:yes gene_type:complete
MGQKTIMPARLAAMLVIGVAAFSVTPVNAHFLSIFAPLAVMDGPTETNVDVLFWHPLGGAHVMDMGGAPEEFFVTHRGERTDLSHRLAEIAFTSAANTGQAYSVPMTFRTSGDYIITAVPQPYYEETEDIFIQQITKAYFNRGQLPTDWSEPLGLKAEILPLSRPYNALVGSTFTGRVLSEGEPVAGAEIEVEYIAAEPDVTTHTSGAPTVSEAAGGTITLMSDANGYFTFGIPTAGWWGFAALGVGPDVEFEGRELSQDAVIWVTAHDLE